MKHFFKNSLMLLALLSGMSSCLVKEKPVPTKPQGAETIASINMSEDYRWQVYFSLKNNTMVGKNLITAWDLGFETTPDGYRIILNGAKFRMAAHQTGKTDFAAVSMKDTAGVPGKIDRPSGSLDSTAIGDWRSGNVYIIHRGTDEGNNDLGYAKIQILSVDDTKYKVRISGIDGSGDKQIDILKDDKYNFAFLSFDNGGKIVLVEPPKAEWDLVFTKYTHFYYDLNMPYAVVGCVLNHYKTSAGRDTADKAFADINLQKASMVRLSSFVTTIGFEWKTYDIGAGKFSVNPNMHYIIVDQQTVYYKLRFTDFYEKGLKGAPKFEFQRL